jgi:hypothetical protein
VAYVRTVKTASGATAVQIVWSSRKGSRQIEHLGSAHDEVQVEVLKAAALQRLAAGQQALDLGLGQVGAAGGPLEIVASCSQHHRAPDSLAPTGRALSRPSIRPGAQRVWRSQAADA